MMSTKKAAIAGEKWKDSEAAQLVRIDLESGKWDLKKNVGGVEMWNSRPEYQMFEKSNFRTNAKRIADSVILTKGDKGKR
jgi:hypothetical protein